NGNMTKDENKDITSIQYNYLNLPTEITFGNGNSIEYIYSAAGVKVSKIVTDLSNTTAPNIFTEYLDGFQYVGGMLNFFPHAEGYVRATSQTEDPADPQLVFNYVYNYTDHLGNIRLSYTKDPVSNELDILEENNYYPFGLKHKVYGGLTKDYLKEEPENGGGGAIRPGVVIDGPYNYKYNGKELQDELGLGWYDYHARNYQPDLGRWTTIDPMAPKYFSHSPYSYTLNNPVYFIDPDGMQVTTGDPEKEEEKLDPVLLPTAVITKKVKKKNSSGSSWGFIPQKYNPFRNFDAGNYFLGYDYEKQHARMQEPYFREGYLKMNAAMNEGYWYTIGFFGIGLAPIILPEIVTFGSIKMFSTKAVISATAQIVVNDGDVGKVDLIDVAADATLIPGVSGAVGGVADFRLSGRMLEINTDPNSILINSATSVISGGMGERFDSSIKLMPTATTQTAAEVMIKTPHSLVEQSLNNSYEHRNK